jgi:hypothetical protein
VEKLVPHNSSVICVTLRVETPLSPPLQEGQHQGLVAALVAGEELGRELAVAHLGHAQGELADPGGELAGAHAVAIPLPLLVALGALRW